MVRLPQPGGDSGSWGDILNDFLVQAHNPDGTLKDDSVTANTIVDGAITTNSIVDGSISEVKLDSATQTKLNATAPVTSVAGKTGDVTLTSADVGLNSVDNTSDASKPVSSATQTALDLKVSSNVAITGATKTKITYDSKGLVMAGLDATTADIADSTDKRYVTDAQQTVIGNTSGTNTGDNAVNSNYSGLVTNATHTGEVTGATALTVDKSAITGKTAVTADGTDYVLISDTSDSGNLKKALASDLTGQTGPAGPTGASGITIVNHGTDANVARPASPLVYWIGTAAPVNALAYDFWYNA